MQYLRAGFQRTQKNMKKILLALAAIVSMVTATAQNTEAEGQDKKLIKHLDVSLTAGSTGIGFDLSTPIGEYVKVRTGLSIMPRVDLPTSFKLQVGDTIETSKSKFEHLSERLSGITGKEVEPKADMVREPTFWNWNVLVDVYPFRENKHWRFTAGFYWGNKTIGIAYNKAECVPTLLAVNMYNGIYEKLHGKTTKELMDVKLIDLGEGYEDFSTDPAILKRLQKTMDYYGRIGVNMGTYKHDILDEEGNVIHKEGDIYRLEPNDESMVKAEMYVNNFKPYLGFGYGGRLIKGDDRYQISFDCGAMFWGGTPRLITHDGTDLTHDVENIPGGVGSDVRLIGALKVYPVLNVRLTRTLF